MSGLTAIGKRALTDMCRRGYLLQRSEGGEFESGHSLSERGGFQYFTQVTIRALVHRGLASYHKSADGKTSAIPTAAGERLVRYSGWER